MSERKGWRARIGWRLRCIADRIDREHAVTRAGNLACTFESGIGLVFHEDGQGCPLWAFEHDRERAYAEAKHPPRLRIDWTTGRAYEYRKPEVSR